MSVIIRLQNLPWSANALDIRQFFNGLSIPEGGVHIVGGEQGDAFIAFSTDEDARQAFNLNGGKIKEVQIKLMLSSRTEMQKVIEAARNPLAAFMQVAPTPQPLPAMIPTAVPALVPEIKKDDKDKQRDGRRRSRSRSRDRKERSRERDRDRRDKRSRRDRSRSRSRDRRDRRRRDRSHSRDRRSKERDRRSKEGRRSEEKTSSNNSNSSNPQKDPTKMGGLVWEDPVRADLSTALQQNPALQQAQALLSSFMPNTLEEARRNLNALAPTPSLLGMNNRNGLQGQTETYMNNRGGRDNWNSNPVGQLPNTRQDFSRFNNRNLPGENTKFNPVSGRTQMGNQQYGDNPRMNYSNRPTRFDNNDRQGLLDRPSLLERPSSLERLQDDSKDCCVQLRPYYGGYGEVRRFFQGLFIHNTGIKFVNDENGKRTGIVYIRFATADGKDKALLRNGELLKTQKVEVKHLDGEVFDTTIDRYMPDFAKERDSPDRIYRKRGSPVYNKPLSQFSCLAVENLPLFTKEQDMLKIFSDYSLLSILLINKQRHITGYIKFSNVDDAKAAQTEKSKHIFDGKPLAIRPCSDEEYAIISQDDQDDTDDVVEIIEDDDEKHYPPSECVMLSGLPLKTTDRDISDFFSDVAIVPSQIHLINSNLGFTGIAFCEFASVDDAEIALDKNGLPLGSGVVSVTSASREEMESKVGIISSGGMPTNSAPNAVRPQFHPGARGGFGGRGGVGGIAAHGPRGVGLMGHRPAMRRFRPPPPISDPNDIALPGHTVRMENVPYKAVLDEILEFFDGFDVPADNVLRRYNENGTPSGEAKVIFNSSKDAYRAVQERHRGKIRERTIFLYQC